MRDSIENRAQNQELSVIRAHTNYHITSMYKFTKRFSFSSWTCDSTDASLSPPQILPYTALISAPMLQNWLAVASFVLTLILLIDLCSPPVLAPAQPANLSIKPFTVYNDDSRYRITSGWGIGKARRDRGSSGTDLQ